MASDGSGAVSNATPKLFNCGVLWRVSTKFSSYVNGEHSSGVSCRKMNCGVLWRVSTFSCRMCYGGRRSGVYRRETEL